MLSLCALACFLWPSAGSAVAARRASATIPSERFIHVETDPYGVTWPWRTFKSSPHTPPNMTITGNGGALADGYIFMTPQSINVSIPSAAENGGFIMTSDGEMVFALNVSGITDFRAQTYDGKPYLTYWSGYNTNGANIGHGYGQVNFLDGKYEKSIVDPNLGLNKLLTTTVANWSIDIHEHQLTPENTIVVSAYNNTPYDLSSFGGPRDGWIVDSYAFELDIATWEVLFQWKASHHVSLNESHQPATSSTSNATKAAPWDWFHINSIQKVGKDYLINSRHCWTSYLISGKDGSVIWGFEGQNGGSFGKPPADGTFRWQHFARAHNVTDTSLDLSIFDNHNAAIDNGTSPSNGLVYHLELPASKSYTPKLLRKIQTPSGEIYADSQGDYVVELSNGNQLLGYGQIAITREYGPATDGSDLRWQAQFGGINTVQSYRAFKQTWQGTPADWDPSLVTADGRAYVSWNGATEVSEWNVYAGLQSSDLKLQGVTTKEGFETVFEIPSGAKVLQVGAVQQGTEVRKSKVVTIST